MTREDKDSLVEMLAKIPVTETRGSLLSAIGKLLRVIDISENSIMIPTLLKDKCEFDAYEMLTLAKILKASILGHNDLVEFYMSESSSQLNSIAQHKQNQQQLQLQHQQLQLQSQTPSLRSSLSDQSTQTTSNSSATSRSTPMTNHNRHHQANLITTIKGASDRLQLNNGEEDATIRLLLQIEQLKTFIPHVTSLFESIIELYKNSVDTIIANSC